MKIIEAATWSKSGLEENNEDTFIATDSFVCVIDGMTPQNKKIYNGKSPARIALKLISNVIQSFETNITMERAAKALSHELYSYYVSNHLLTEVKAHPFKRMGANLVIFSKFRSEVWMIGDCQCLIDKVHIKNEKMIDHLLAEMRGRFLDQYLLFYTVEELIHDDLSAKDMAPFIRKQYHYQNTTSSSALAYTVLDGFTMNLDQIKVINVEKANELVLASDGYPYLMPALNQTEIKLKKILAEDPLCHRIFPSVKGLRLPNISYDDRTYVRIKL